MPLYAAAAAPPPLSSVRFLSSAHHLVVSVTGVGGGARRGDLVIRMGGGPRTYPGGVSKWQWKRMQAKKAKQLLKARLARERQLYEMRKRAELRAAVSELERPWEQTAPPSRLLSVGADEQVKALADRFHRPGGLDMWNERDGPQVFRSPTSSSSARFFPNNAVHSVQPYGFSASSVEEEDVDGAGMRGVRGNANERDLSSSEGLVSDSEEEKNGDLEPNWRARNAGTRRWQPANATIADSEDAKDGDFEPKWRERSKGNGRKNGVGSRRAADVMNSGNAGKEESDWIGGGLVSNYEETEDDFEPRWNASKNGAGSWKPASAWYSGNAGKEEDIDKNGGYRRDWIGDGFDSGSEESRDDGSELNWRARNRGNGRNAGIGRWKPANVAVASRKNEMGKGERYQKDRTGNGFVSLSEETGDSNFRQNRTARSRGGGRKNQMARWNPANVKNPGNAGKEEGNWIGDGVVSASEETTKDGDSERKWRARNGVNRRKNGAAIWKPVNAAYSGNAGKEAGGNNIGRYRTRGSGRFKGIRLRPTSELYNSWNWEDGSNQME